MHHLAVPDHLDLSICNALLETPTVKDICYTRARAIFTFPTSLRRLPLLTAACSSLNDFHGSQSDGCLYGHYLDG